MNNESDASKQHVLVLPRTTLAYYYCERFHEDIPTIRAIRSLVEEKGYFIGRQPAEQDPSVVQVIAYGILRYQDKILCMRRSRKSNRRTLRLKYTVLFGGHVDDAHSDSPVESSVIREFQEELGVSNPAHQPRLLGVATDPTNEVGRRHLGMIFDIPHPNNVVHITSLQDTAEFVYAGKSSRHEFMGWEELRGYADQLDPWSRLFLASDCATALLKAPMHIVAEKPLELLWLPREVKAH